MNTTCWTEADTKKALELWAEYQKVHDVSDRKGQAVGIDPSTGQVWFGESATDIWKQREDQGQSTPLLYLRVGHSYYQRKGGRR